MKFKSSRFSFEDSLHQHMDDIGDSLRQTILKENVELLLENKIVPAALPNGFVTVDIEVTLVDNSKPKKERLEVVSVFT